MIKKLKHLFVLLLVTLTLSSVSAAGADVVVLMDASGTILPWFDQINNRILVDITKKFIRPGDTFHLISFNSRVNLEIVQPVKTEADISRIVSRFMLLYPIGQNSDFLTGLQYTWQYVQTLDHTRQKIVIFISDGIFNPPSSSSFAAFSPDEVKGELTSYARRIRGAGWSIYYIKLPFPENSTIISLDGKSSVAGSKTINTQQTSTAASNALESNALKTNANDSISTQAESTGPSYIDISSDFLSELNIPGSILPSNNTPINFVDTVFSMPTVVFQNSLGKKGRTFIFPIKITNPTTSQLHIELTGIISNGVNYLEKNAFVTIPSNKTKTLRSIISLPDTIPEGALELPIELRFADSLRTNPQTTTLSLVVTGFSLVDFMRTSGAFFYTLFLFLIAVAVVILFFIIFWKHSATSTKEAVFAIGKPIEDSSKKSEEKTTQQIQNAKVETISEKNAHVQLIKQSVQPKNAFHIPLIKSNKQIDFSVSKETSTDALNSLANEAQNIKNERLSVLNAAQLLSVRKKSHIKAANPDEPIAIKEHRSCMFELAVCNQNTHIGKRNIHIMKPGTKLSIGGGSSSFLVFLVKFPARIADIRFDGQTCNLAILKPQYFPFETENVITNCLNREFTIISDKNYEVKFSIKDYEDPVVTLNNILTSIKY